MFKSNIQIFIENTIKTFLSVLKIVLLSKFFLRIRFPKKKSESCIILANGPSLNDSIRDHSDFIRQHDLLGVNFFAQTDFFTQYQPLHYVIIAKELWDSRLSDERKQIATQLFTTISEKTTWEMTLYVPAIARKHGQWLQIVGQNKNLTVNYMNITPVEGFSSFSRWCYGANLGMPRPHNVVIPSLKLCIEANYKQIYLLGVDHSWLKDLCVNDKNEVLLAHKHFYDEKTAKPVVMYKGSNDQGRNMADVLIKFVYTFLGYYQLRHYAECKNIKILNATPNSFVDAFDRVTL